MTKNELIARRTDELIQAFPSGTFGVLELDKSARDGLRGMLSSAELMFCGPIHYNDFWKSKSGEMFWNDRSFWANYFDSVVRNEFTRYHFWVKDSWHNGHLKSSKLILVSTDMALITPPATAP